MTDIIDDPLARFFNEEQSRTAGVKNPVTGIREPYDKAQRDRIRSDEIKRRSEVHKRVLTQLLNDDLGREWLYNLLVSCNVEGTPFTDNERTTAYNSGALHIGIILKADLKRANIKQYFLMIEEGYEREVMWDNAVVDKL